MQSLKPHLCEDLYTGGGGLKWTPPYFAYGHTFPGRVSGRGSPFATRKSNWLRCDHIALEENPGYQDTSKYRFGAG